MFPSSNHSSSALENERFPPIGTVMSEPASGHDVSIAVEDLAMILAA